MSGKIVSKPLVIGTAATALAFGLAGYVWLDEHREPLLEIYVFNLKSGSSIFIRTPEDKRILVNGGGNSEVIRGLTGILPFYSRRIDMIIATDADGKDVSGLIDVLERYSVDTVVVPAVSLQSLGLATSTDQIYATFLDTVRRLKVPLQGVSADDTLDFGQKIGSGKVVAKILFPAASTSFAYSKASAPEIVMKIIYGRTSVMWLGNATTKVQKFLVSSKSTVANDPSGDLHTDILIVPHGASSGSLSIELMDKMKPEYLVYSQATIRSPKTGAKSPLVKDRKIDPLYFILDDKRFNIKEKGTVKIVSDGSLIKIEQ